MQWFYDLKIRTKLLGAFFLMSVITIIIGVQGINNMGTINDMMGSLYQQETMGISYLKEANIDLIYYARAEANLLLSSSAADRAKFSDRMTMYEGMLKSNIASAKPLLHTDKAKDLIVQFENSWNEYKRISNQMLQLAQNDQLAAYRQSVELFQTEGRQKIDLVDTVLSQLARVKEQNGKQFYSESTAIYESNRKFMIIFLIGAVCAGIALGLFISSYISKGVKQIAERFDLLEKESLANLENGALKMAEGDLNIKITSDVKALEVKSKDEIGDLAASANLIIKKTQATISSVENAAGVVREMVTETKSLVQSALDGKLSQRGNADKFNGGYKEVIDGLNNTLDAVVNPIHQSTRVLEVMAQGDLTARMDGEYKGDYKMIKDSINQLADSMGNALSEVSEAVQATASAANEISSSSEQMAAGAQEQSQQATEVAGAIEEMTKTVYETAKNANEAADMSRSSRVAAEKGAKKIDETKKGIEKIVVSADETARIVASLSQRSEQIGEITQVIDDIADQTNLLALNAAIEAARAGEQGRGFAVVADEVRKLAERTTKATKEIAETIKAIQTEAKEADSAMSDSKTAVVEGMKMTEEVAEVLNEILKGAVNATDVVMQVAAASEEQSSAAEQISKNIEGISSVTQQSAAGTEQIARAAEDLNRLTVNLQELVARFKLEENAQKRNLSFNRTSVRNSGMLIGHQF